ncbi:MAG TPA: phage tail tape measure protein [Methylomirabilota bacterium]|jgi:hypothetical protein|nr:phage tail tape measure protein [Methylomirabilota bacterium]
MAAPIGALRAELSATAAKFEADLGRARKALGFTKGQFESLKSAATAASAGIAAAVTALAAITKSTANAGDQLAKMSQKVGVSVEDLSALKHAANLSDVSLEQLQVGLGRLARNMSDASMGSGEAAQHFKALGITVANADGSLRPIRDVLLEVSDRFAGMTDETRKAALAQELFGKSGLELVPLLNQGSAAIKAQMEEAKRLGIVWSTDAAQAAEAFNDNLTRLGSALEGVKLAIGTALIPVLRDLTDRLVQFVQTDQFRGWAREVGEILRVSTGPGLMFLARAAVVVVNTFRVLMTALTSVVQAILAVNIAVREGGLFLRRFLGSATEEAASKLAELKAAFEVNSIGMKLLIGDVAASDAALTALEHSLATLGQTTIPPATAGVKTFTAAVQGAKGATADWLVTLNGVSQPLAQLAAEQAPFADAFGHSFGKIETDAGEMMITLGNVTQSVRDMAAQQAPFADAFEQSFGRIKTGASTMWQSLLATFQTASDGLRTMAQTTATMLTTAFTNMTTLSQDQMTQLSTAIGTLLGGIFGQTKAFAIIMAIISTAQGVARALADWPWPFSLVVAGIVAAAGAVQISTISNAEMAMGGIVTGPTMALIGEAGPEAVIPLDRLGRFQERETVIHVHTHLDGREISKSVLVLHGPNLIRQRTGLRSL